MIDVLTAAEIAIRGGSAQAPLWAAAAGAISGCGPCAASRAAVLGAFVGNAGRRRAFAILAAFVLGTAMCYAGLGLASASAGRIASTSPYLYAAAALALAGAGVAELCGGLREHRSHHACAPSLGAAFSVGALSAAVLSPCCAPLVFPVLAFAVSSGDVRAGVALLVCFALGHAMPSVFAASFGIAPLRRAGDGVREALRVIGGAVMIAMGAYYGVLA